MIKLLSRPIAALLLGAACATQASAGVAFTGRSVLAQINGTAPDFADATLTAVATTEVGAGSSGSRTLDFGTAPNIVSYTTSSTGGVTLTGTTLGAGGTFQSTVGARGAGSFTFKNEYPVEDDPFAPSYGFRYTSGNDVFVPFDNYGLPALEVYLPIVGAGLVDQDGVFTVGVSIAGDYSSTGGLASTSGQHFLANLDPAWTITRDFVFDAVSGRTLFTAVNRAYQYDPGDSYFGQSPALDVYFFGGAVPEPASWTLMVGGFGLAGASLRRRRGVALA